MVAVLGGDQDRIDLECAGGHGRHQVPPVGELRDIGEPLPDLPPCGVERIGDGGEHGSVLMFPGPAEVLLAAVAGPEDRQPHRPGAGGINRAHC